MASSRGPGTHQQGGTCVESRIEGWGRWEELCWRERRARQWLTPLPALRRTGSAEFSGVIPDLWPSLPDPLPWYLQRTAVLTWVTLLVAPALGECSAAPVAGPRQAPGNSPSAPPAGCAAAGKQARAAVFATGRAACRPALLLTGGHSLPALPMPSPLPKCPTLVPKTLGEVALVSVLKIFCTLLCVAALLVLLAALAMQGALPCRIAPHRAPAAQPCNRQG